MYHQANGRAIGAVAASMTSLSARDDNFDSKTCYRQLNKIMNDCTDFKSLFRISAPAHVAPYSDAKLKCTECIDSSIAWQGFDSKFAHTEKFV